MKLLRKLSLVSLLLIFALVLVACSPAESATENPTPETAANAEAEAGSTEEPVAEAEETAEEEMAEQTIVDIAVADGRFETLVTAVTEAGLAETLSGEGPFTVFAPTDEAFAALPEGTVESLLADPEGALTDVLLYHVVDGAVMAETVVTLESATTLQGEEVSITVNEDGVFLNDDIEVVITDIEASNGVIHVIDGVLLPPSG